MCPEAGGHGTATTALASSLAPGVKAGMGKFPRGHSHGTGPHIQPGVVFSQRQLHSLQRVEGSKQQAPLEPTRTTTRPYACGLGLWNIVMLPREQDISQKQWDILLTTMISPIYLHQGPTKLGKGTPGDAQQLQFTELQSFQAELRDGNGKGCDTPAQGQKQIPQNLQAKLGAAKGPVHPNEFLVQHIHPHGNAETQSGAFQRKLPNLRPT